MGIMGEISTWKISPGSLERPLVIAHRGCSSLAPENTMAAFREALELGADAVEVDVRLTRDGHVVVMHDRRLDRTTTGNGPVGRHTLRELKELDAGSWFDRRFIGERVPTLDEVFDEIPRKFPLYVEMKVRGFGAGTLVRRVVDIIRQRDRWDSTMVASFNPVAMAIARFLEPRTVRGYIWSANHPLPLRARWLSALVRPLWMAPDRNTFTWGMLDRFHHRGNLVAARDVDVVTDMAQMKEIGLDAVVTDHPEDLVAKKHVSPR